VKPFENIVPQLCLEPGQSEIIGIQRFGGEALTLNYTIAVKPVQGKIKFV